MRYIQIHNAVKFIVREHNDEPGLLVVVALVDGEAKDERIVKSNGDPLELGEAMSTMYTAHKKDMNIPNIEF